MHTRSLNQINDDHTLYLYKKNNFNYESTSSDYNMPKIGFNAF